MLVVLSFLAPASSWSPLPLGAGNAYAAPRKPAAAASVSVELRGWNGPVFWPGTSISVVLSQPVPLAWMQQARIQCASPSAPIDIEYDVVDATDSGGAFQFKPRWSKLSNLSLPQQCTLDVPEATIDGRHYSWPGPRSLVLSATSKG